VSGKTGKRIDANHKAIVAELRRYPGCKVQSLAEIGNGCPDILASYACVNWLFEIKDPAKKPSARKLTLDQKVWHFEWTGQVAIIETADEALKLMGVIE